MSRFERLVEQLLAARWRTDARVLPLGDRHTGGRPRKDRPLFADDPRQVVRSRDDLPRAHLRGSRTALSLASLLFAATLAVCGTAAADTRVRVATANAAAPTDRADAARSRGRSAAPKHVPARLDVVDATAFTITEQARIAGDARTQYDAAVRLLEQERYAEGVALMLQVADKAPNVTAPQINLGIAYKRMGDLERAEASFAKARELNPNHPVVHDELGLLYRETGRFAEARASYEKALAIYPGFHFAHRNLAILCDVYLNDLPCALTHYEAYAVAEPDDTEVQKWIADLHNRLR